MNTMKVRPVLVESKEPNKLRLNNKSKLTFEPQIKGLHYNGLVHTYQQLILISLEDEKIEVGDTKLLTFETFDGLIETIITTKEFIGGNYKTISESKVIATQSQLSPELIKQLIDEYNNGDMKDFEIEIDTLNKK